MYSSNSTVATVTARLFSESIQFHTFGKVVLDHTDVSVSSTSDLQWSLKVHTHPLVRSGDVLVAKAVSCSSPTRLPLLTDQASSAHQPDIICHGGPHKSASNHMVHWFKSQVTAAFDVHSTPDIQPLRHWNQTNVHRSLRGLRVQSLPAQHPDTVCILFLNNFIVSQIRNIQIIITNKFYMANSLQLVHQFIF